MNLHALVFVRAPRSVDRGLLRVLRNAPARWRLALGAATVALWALAMTGTARAQPVTATPAPECTVGEVGSLGTSTWRRHAVALASTADATLAVVLPAAVRADVFAISRTGAPGTPRSIAVAEGEQLVDLLPVAGAFLLRSVKVCPNTGRQFHKCLTLRVFDADGQPRGAPLVEDVIEWSGVGAPLVVGARVVMLRRPLYDRGGIPSVATYEVSATGVARIGEVRALGDVSRPDAAVVAVARGAGWAAVLHSNVSEEPPLLVSDDPARLIGLRSLPSELTLRALDSDANGLLLTYEAGDPARSSTVRIADDARATVSRVDVRTARVPATNVAVGDARDARVAQPMRAEVRAHRGHVWLQRRDGAGARVGRELDLGEARAPRGSLVTPAVTSTANGWLVTWVARAAPRSGGTPIAPNARETFVRHIACSSTR